MPLRVSVLVAAFAACPALLPSSSYVSIIFRAHQLLTYPCWNLNLQECFLDHSVRNFWGFRCFSDKAHSWNFFGSGGVKFVLSIFKLSSWE